MYEKQRDRALVRAVELYYYEGMTQAAISDRLGCTRWTVGRLLKEAEDRGIVRVSIRHPFARSNQLEQQLKRTFGLRDARVVPTQSVRADNLALVARTTADYLSDIRPRPQVVGVACGRTTASVARALTDNWALGVAVTQVCAIPAEADDMLTGATVRIFAKRGRGIWRTLTAPTFGTDQEEAEQIRHSPDIEEGLALAVQADLVLYSPGLVSPESALAAYSHQGPEEISRLRDLGAVATIANRYIDSSGTIVDPEMDARTIGIDLETIRKTRNAVMVGSGVDKRPGFAAALAARLATSIVTDSETAEYLLDSAY